VQQDFHAKRNSVEPHYVARDDSLIPDAFPRQPFKIPLQGIRSIAMAASRRCMK
jgi:hypothetical protein